MADNSVALGRGSGPDLFADDDPLAELARIAGYDERPSQRSQPMSRQAAMPGSQSRREPAFNLEDELLREFESYEAPRLDPSDDLPLDAPVADAAIPARPNFHGQDADHSRRSYSLDAYPEAVRAAEPRGRDPFADLDDVEARQTLHASPAPSADAMFSQGGDGVGSGDWSRDAVQPEPVAEPAFDRADLFELDGVSRDAVRAAPEPSIAQPVMDENFELDLISELETSLVTAPAPVARKPSSRPPAKAYEPGFRMPLANFHRAPERVGEPPMTAASSQPPEPRFEQAPLDMARAQPGWDMRAAPQSTFEQPAFDQPAPARAEPRPDLFDPELLPSDFARDVADAQTIEPVQAPSNGAPKERFSPQEEPVYDVGHYTARSSQPRTPNVAEPAFASRGLDMAPASKQEPAPLDLLNEDDFELSLEELELDFSDLLADEPRAPAPSFTVAAAPARPQAPVELPVAAREAMPSAPVAPPSPFAARPHSVAPSVSPVVPAFLASSRSAAGMEEQPSPVSSRAAAMSAPVPDFAPDAFDPALFADTEEMLESVPDLNVPDLPVHEPEQRPVVHSDFDLHLDSELASLFETHTAQPAATREPPKSRATPSAAQSIAAVAPAPQQPLSANEFDDFERALEEDFRRTLSQPIQPGRSDGLDEGEEDLEAYYEAPRRTSARWIVPASVAGLVLVAGVSAYAWFAGGASGIGGNGAPVVIAADTDAIKVVPENPGGKTVPNQDKAVYDRVAGGALNDPKQSSLISSDEQPMDVVQKTLMPDNLPMEGEEDGTETAATDVGDTQDPRLLPQQATAQSGQQAGDQLAVMPRRVKTMIVRPDGTLVEQVSDVPAQASTQARPVRAETVAASPALAEPKSVAGITPISQPQGTAPTELASVDVEQTTALTGTQDAAASETAPAPQFAAPVPMARPSRQPTNAVASAADAAARPIQTSAPVAAASSSSSGAGGYYIQVASLPSEAEAQKSYANISSKFASVVSGRAHDIARADIAGKGTYYRVRIAAGSTKDEAAALCERYRAAGGSCLIAR
jgi:hypothetical protein